MGNMHLVTGYAGQEHITAADQGAFHTALFGEAQLVLGKGNRLAASVISNNQIRVFDGDIIMQGRYIRLNEDTYVDLAIENGEQGMLRNDLIVARYTRNTVTGVEDVNLVVIKGTAVASNPVDPVHTVGDLLNEHDALNDMPLYRVVLNGLNVAEPVQLFDVFGATIPAMHREVQPVSKGGTGATTAAEARKKLSVYSKEEIDAAAPYKKEETFSAEAKMEFGFGTAAVPADAFLLLSPLMHHWWKQYTGVVYKEVRRREENETIWYGADNHDHCVFRCATGYEFDKTTGLYTLTGEITTITLGENASDPSAMLGKYVSYDWATENSFIYEIPLDAAFSGDCTWYNGTLVISEAYRLSRVVDTTSSESVNVHSADRNKYSETAGGYEYLGTALDILTNSLRIVQGTYIGTGTSGYAYPNTLYCEHEPKVVIIKHAETWNVTEGEFKVWTKLSEVSGNDTVLCNQVEEDKSLWEFKWWNTQAGYGRYQMNMIGNKYEFIIIY